MYLETEETRAQAEAPKLQFEHTPTTRLRLDQMSELVDYFCPVCGESHQVKRSIGSTTKNKCKCDTELCVIQDDRDGEVCAIGWKPRGDKESRDAYKRWEDRAVSSAGEDSTFQQADEDKTWTAA